MSNYSREHKCDKGTTNNNSIKNVPEVPEITSWMQNYTKIQKFENHLNSKDASKDVVKVGENNIPVTLFLHGVFCSESDGTEDDDYHDEGVKEWVSHNSMDS